MSEYFYVDILRCLKEIYSSYLSVHTVPGTKLPQKILLLVKIEEGGCTGLSTTLPKCRGRRRCAAKSNNDVLKPLTPALTNLASGAYR